ncbi:MAG: hypothetical protein K2K79_08660 [Paramuribaculum sp.]|nr:hypothetical protein [Paramuribaculum sp.]
MIKAIRTLAIVAIAIFAMAACSGKKQLDTEKIMSYAQAQTELTESDYDFFIDQLEVIADMTQGMDKKEANEYINNLPEDQQQAMVVVSLVIMGSGDKLTDAQKERILALEEKVKE